MTFARWYMIINGMMLGLYGVYCIYNPQIVADMTFMTVSPSALTEIRAMYGGLEVALGLFFMVMAFDARRIETALIAMTMCFAGLGSTRVIGILMNGLDPYNTNAIIYESISTVLAVISLIKVRNAISR